MWPRESRVEYISMCHKQTLRGKNGLERLCLCERVLRTEEDGCLARIRLDHRHGVRKEREAKSDGLLQS